MDLSALKHMQLFDGPILVISLSQYSLSSLEKWFEGSSRETSTVAWGADGSVGEPLKLETLFKCD